jgi:hypothetical protein
MNTLKEVVTYHSDSSNKQSSSFKAFLQDNINALRVIYCWCKSAYNSNNEWKNQNLRWQAFKRFYQK